ncbi:hypothetical protein QBC39DRAFT_87981 [Podospora conica]|nr:hypothetical protein QBC39DRAFT_87981 [Schizothecium conicum]
MGLMDGSALGKQDYGVFRREDNIWGAESALFVSLALWHVFLWLLVMHVWKCIALMWAFLCCHILAVLCAVLCCVVCVRCGGEGLG